MPLQFSSTTEGMVSPLDTSRSIIWRKLGGHCTHERFYMHQVPLAYLAVFRQTGLEPGLSGPELRTLSTGQPQLSLVLRWWWQSMDGIYFSLGLDHIIFTIGSKIIRALAVICVRKLILQYEFSILIAILWSKHLSNHNL